MARVVEVAGEGRRERVLALLAEERRLIDGISGHMTEIEELLTLDDPGDGREGGDG